MQGDEGWDVSEKEDEQGQHKHTHKTEHRIQLLQPRRRVEAVRDTLVEVLNEGTAHHMEHQHLRKKIYERIRKMKKGGKLDYAILEWCGISKELVRKKSFKKCKRLNYEYYEQREKEIQMLIHYGMPWS